MPVFTMCFQVNHFRSVNTKYRFFPLTLRSRMNASGVACSFATAFSFDAKDPWKSNFFPCPLILCVLPAYTELRFTRFVNCYDSGIAFKNNNMILIVDRLSALKTYTRNACRTNLNTRNDFHDRLILSHKPNSQFVPPRSVLIFRQAYHSESPFNTLLYSKKQDLQV